MTRHQHPKVVLAVPDGNPAGIIYATDAYSAGLSSVAEAGSDLCKPAIYLAAVLKTSAHQEGAQAFLDYLQTDECMKVFEEVGFIKAQ